jgi:hypothetical protein
MKTGCFTALVLFGTLSCNTPVREVWIESPINKGLKSELEKCSDQVRACKANLLEYTACCQDCLTYRVNKAVDVRR